jgi:hypothetical protein
MEERSARAWIWASLLLQLLGYIYDAVWHGLLNPGVEPRTVAEMAWHLGTVHLPLYVGAASVLVSTSSALLSRVGRSPLGVALPVAVAGAWLSAGAEAWHALSHLRLDTHTAPIAGTLSFVGFLAAVLAMASERWAKRKRASETSYRRRAA